MVGRRDEARILTQLLAPVDVRMDGLALDRARPDERDLHGQVVEVLRPRPQQALHLRAALDLESADRVGTLDVLVRRRIVERDARKIDRPAAHARDLLDALLDRRQHPQAEQVDLQEAGVVARVLVPLAHLPAGHRRRLDGDELDQRPRRDHHPARMLRDVAREPADLGAELAERAPAGRGELRVRIGQRRQLVPDAPGVAVRQARQPFELAEGQAERLAQVADRAARVIGREAGDERGMLAAVLLRHRHDQLLADVAREVEVDVGDGLELAVQEPSERELGLDRDRRARARSGSRRSSRPSFRARGRAEGRSGRRKRL